MNAIGGAGSVDRDTTPLKAVREGPRGTHKLVSVIETTLCARPDEYGCPVTDGDTSIELNSAKIPRAFC